MNKLIKTQNDDIKSKILTIRNKKVILDRDLAKLYEVSTGNLNKAVKRNIKRFPEDFMFQLSKKEFENLLFQFGISSWGGVRTPPFAFTEHGVTALSGILKSEKAIDVNIKVIRAFVAMRYFLSKNADIFFRLDAVERKQAEYQISADKRFDEVFKAIGRDELKQGIFYNGQVFDAHNFISDIIRSAKTSIILIDNYIDDSVLELFTKRKKGVDITIYTKITSNQLKTDLKKYSAQYGSISIKEFKHSHDRFIIIDNKEVYHIGASLKDLGKRWFAFSRLDRKAFEMLNKLY